MPNGNNSENIENYNENVQEYYAKLNELEREGEWDKIVDMVCAPIMIDPNTNSMEGRDDDLDDAFDLWARPKKCCGGSKNCPAQETKTRSKEPMKYAGMISVSSARNVRKGYISALSQLREVLRRHREKSSERCVQRSYTLPVLKWQPRRGSPLNSWKR